MTTQPQTPEPPLTPAERRDCLATFNNMTVDQFAHLIGWKRGGVRRAFSSETQFVAREIDDLLRDLRDAMTRYRAGMAAFREARKNAEAQRDAA
jgi:hypothetical protein